MRKILSVLIICCGFFLLASCASRSGGPADVTDANGLYSGSGDSGVQTAGLGNTDNLIATQKGTHNGILAKRSLYFDFDSNVVRSDDVATVKAHGKYLLTHPQSKVVLEGNTDSRGSREYNIALGQRRADSVKSILRMQGVSNKQVRSLSYGAEKPVALGHNESDYQLNRRVDIVYE